ncbi:MAG TPA: HAD family acid phosphatase [Thermoanaerobaculia bacterium]|jgi:acid phosphatase
MRQALALLALAFTACATTPATAPTSPAASPAATTATSPCSAGHTLINASLWVQSAAEYEAAALQTYGNARRMLDAALADPTWSAMPGQNATAAMPPAVILDLDETVLDNVRFEARMVRAGKTYTPEDWLQWVSESAAGTVPGAREFLEYARGRGVTPFYITGRKAVEEAATLRNLQQLGLPLSAAEDTLFVRGERPEWDSGDKGPRREYVASRYRVLLLVGDDLNDFVNAREKSQAEREEIMRTTAANWGTKWFMLSNPMYGSWEDAAAAGKDCEKVRNKIEALKP